MWAGSSRLDFLALSTWHFRCIGNYFLPILSSLDSSSSWSRSSAILVWSDMCSGLTSALEICSCIVPSGWVLGYCSLDKIGLTWKETFSYRSMVYYVHSVLLESLTDHWVYFSLSEDVPVLLRLDVNGQYELEYLEIVWDGHCFLLYLTTDNLLYFFLLHTLLQHKA